jgi:hypothetical protein
MAHYALLDENNIVTGVIYGKDEDEKRNGEDIDWEIWMKDFHGAADCKRTSFNTSRNVHRDGGTPFRGNYAGPGYIYDPTNDVFYTPKRFDSWTMDTNTWCWKAPLDQTDAELGYFWDEDLYQSDNTKGWVEEEPD